MKELLKFLGFETNTTSHVEKLVAAIGGFSGIILTLAICRYFLGSDAYIVVASLGASAVLVFALPHVSVSQPWSLVGGQVVSASVGVTCAKFIADITVAASLVCKYLFLLHSTYLHSLFRPACAWGE